jgi:hypothetical protein
MTTGSDSRLNLVSRQISALTPVQLQTEQRAPTPAQHNRAWLARIQVQLS